jgi:hypothetical protein
MLNSDVRRILEDVMKDRGVPFKQALNDAIRAGVKAGRRFMRKTYSMGAVQLFRWDEALAAADAIGDEQLVRELALHK